jgi:hypothetical protein
MDPKDRCRWRRSRALDVMIRSLVLFTHVVAVMGLFVGLVLEWFVLDGMRRAATREEGITWIRLIVAAQRVMSIAFGVILLSGLALGRQVGVLGDGWILASYGAILLIGLSGGLMARRVVRPLRLAIENPNDRTFIAAQASASAWVARLALRSRVALALAIVYLMIDKPDAGISIVVISIALLIAMLATLRKQPAASIVVEGHR